MSNTKIRRTCSTCSLFFGVSLAGCDSGTSQDTEQVLTFQLPEVRRSIQNVTSTDLKLEYELTVFDDNGAQISTLERTVESNAPDLTPDVEVGWQVQYTFEWIHKNFDVSIARAARTLTVERFGQVEEPNYDFSINSDTDNYTNEEELNLGYSPVSAQDSPTNEFISTNNVQRAFLLTREWNSPVFGCRNPPDVFGDGTDPWYWIFNSNGLISRIEGSPPQVMDNRGDFTPSSQPTITSYVDGRTFVWSFDVTTQYMRVLPENGARVWGECLLLAGPRMDSDFTVLID